MQTHLVTFGTENYHNSVQSLIKSSNEYFTNHHTFSTKDIDSDFYKENIEILEQGRGAGYWLWKPYFIKKMLMEVDENDVIFYVDSGNVFLNDPSFIYSNLDKNNGIVLFDNKDGVQNGDATILMTVNNNGNLIAEGQITCLLYTISGSYRDLLGVYADFTPAGSFGYYQIKIIEGTFTGFHRCFTDDEFFNKDEPQLFRDTYEGRIVVRQELWCMCWFSSDNAMQCV
jgi:hypothetical protein